MNVGILILGSYLLYNFYKKPYLAGGNSKIYNYYVKPSSLDYNFQKEVINILNNNTVWKNDGFILIPTDEKNANFTIELRHREKMPKYGNDTYKNGKKIYFSLTVNGKIILIDHINWKGVPESLLSVPEYKKYVITHEVGHALGFDHEPCMMKNNKCDVMYQMTRGPPDGYHITNEMGYGVDY